MCMTYYTVDDLRPGRPGWDVRQFSALAEAIDPLPDAPHGRRVSLAWRMTPTPMNSSAVCAFSPATPRARTFWRQITGAAA